MFDSGSASGLLDSVPDWKQPATLQEHHAHIAREHFREIHAVTAVYLARCEEDGRRGNNEAHQGEFAHVEIAAILHVTESAAARMIDLGCDLRLRLHRVSAAFAAGTIDLTQTRAIVGALANVSDDKLDDIENRLLSDGDHLTSTKLKQRARRLIARYDPDGVHRRRERAEEDRDVRTHASDDGMSTLEGLLPAVGAQRLSMRLREMSLQVCADDPRTHAQRRADALIALTDGADHLPCHCRREHCTATKATERLGTEDVTTRAPREKATILVGVSATTLLGLDDLPGYLYGYGAIDADLARDIAADGTWKQILTLTGKDRERLIEHLLDELRAAAPELFYETTENDEPWVSGRRIDTNPPGPILGVGNALRAAGITPSNIRSRTKTSREAHTYQPSKRLAEIIRTRDGTCRFPNCTARAQDCDLDHTIPFNHANPANGGLTVEENLACLCRKHHRLKTEGYWTVTQLGSGLLRWTDPHGTITVTEPNGPFSDPVDEHNDDDHDTTDARALRVLSDRNSGRTAEDDLAYLLDTLVPPGARHPKPRIPAGPILVIDLDEPPPF
uniref:HNH endonuclease signature motif containing protein n=1 Tax=Rhodococcus oryzae TaxID=2571143 RepID=UPI001FE50E11|nr:HNH endonuclease signature motif containing protein [Rhodococcus oryzae]